MIVASCGHRVEHVSDLWDSTLRAYDRVGNRAVEYASLCKPCRDQAVANGDVLYDQGEENKWLGGK